MFGWLRRKPKREAPKDEVPLEIPDSGVYAEGPTLTENQKQALYRMGLSGVSDLNGTQAGLLLSIRSYIAAVYYAEDFDEDLETDVMLAAVIAILREHDLRDHIKSWADARYAAGEHRKEPRLKKRDPNYKTVKKLLTQLFASIRS